MTQDPGGTLVAEPAPEPTPPWSRTGRTAGDVVRFFVRGLGQTLITAGVVVLLFVVYEVYVTNIVSHREQTRVHTALEQTWAKGADPLTLPGSGTTTIPIGEGIANLYIPRLGRDYAWTIVEGADDASLEKGPGHYVRTALPGQIGNFSVAGHRVGKGEPFLNLDKLRPGDSVIVETKTMWWIYQVKGDTGTGELSALGKDGVPGREIVAPSDGSVILPVPDHPGVSPTEALMTMTTCHPKFTAAQRMIVHAMLVGQLPKKAGEKAMPAPVLALYDKVSR